MRLEQAIFTSAQTSFGRGYHLVARSSGVSERLAQQLSLWAPSESCLVDGDIDADSLNVFPLDDDWIAISRTVCADAEYSDRGQFRMETNFLTAQRSQLAGYDYNPVSVARMAQACGHLRLREALPAGLQPVELPSVGTRNSSLRDDAVDNGMAASILERYRTERIVVAGCDSPRALLHAILNRLPAEHRLDLSFSTGLKPSNHRPFRLQFVAEVSGELARDMAARGMTCLTA
jgi:GTPase-associated protein 1, N-terminal domain type 2